MATISVPKPTHDRIELLARAWSVPEAAVIDRLLEEFQAGRADSRQNSEDRDASAGVKIYADYQGVRTEALFDPVTHGVRLTSGPLAGQNWKSPSGAAVAVVRDANPGIRAERNGWGFWVVADTGEALQTLRA